MPDDISETSSGDAGRIDVRRAPFEPIPTFQCRADPATAAQRMVDRIG
ncbi:hypothetical protein [Sphingomonas adhaesiva]